MHYHAHYERTVGGGRWRRCTVHFEWQGYSIANYESLRGTANATNE